ncbi:hypothetical protein SpiBuddy_1870 [Sphaerochaeta globosa str. Buddy]|uniref:Uncharacterized protein n=1 Tax=Sphaerochaeta globosa (strain ATCC BAA-1886 / DSM 22777 / Buddy) TaxID=158189 RepID=F0RWR3_SPHGB|nr:hypothetical protein SpiBuddy_1870 [Sphaerochaeta globosa str. Buddy]
MCSVSIPIPSITCVSRRVLSCFVPITYSHKLPPKSSIDTFSDKSRLSYLNLYNKRIKRLLLADL